MGTGSENRYTGLRSFLSRLRDLAEALPSQADKEAAKAQIQQIVEFMAQVQSALDSMPSHEETEGIRRGIQQLENLRVRAKTNPVLAAALGMDIPKAPRSPQPPATSEERSRAEGLLRELRALSIDEMRRRLAAEDVVTSRELQEVAKLVGIKASRRMEREALIHHIVTKISNFRGYQELRGEPGEPTPGDPAK